jgi:hypothetical protein
MIINEEERSILRNALEHLKELDEENHNWDHSDDDVCLVCGAIKEMDELLDASRGES